MRNAVMAVMLLFLLMAAGCASAPVPLIFDTDIGNDIDDAMALAMIHSLVDAGEARLLGVTITKDDTHAAPYVDLVNTFYGRGEVPIGAVRGGKTPGDSKFTKSIVAKAVYPHDIKSNQDVPDATTLLRKLLAGYRRDRAVVLVVVGFSTNISRLLNSKPDAISPLDGKALVARKVKLLSIMAGAYGGPRKPEYNVITDIPAARNVYRNWPTPIVASGYEIGTAILYPARSILEDFNYVEHHPIKEGYALYGKMPYDRPTWDLTSVLYAVRPGAGDFGLSPSGTITVQDDGRTEFSVDPAGRHRYLTVTPEPIERLRQTLVTLVSKPPGA